MAFDMFGRPMPDYYGNQYNNMMQRQMQMQPQPQIQTQITQVNGEAGANAYQLAPNSSALLLDTTGAIVWLAQTDGAGYKTVQAFDIIPHRSKQEPDVVEISNNIHDIDNRLKKLEEELYGKPNPESNDDKQH